MGLDFLSSKGAVAGGGGGGKGGGGGRWPGGCGCVPGSTAWDSPGGLEHRQVHL